MAQSEAKPPLLAFNDLARRYGAHWALTRATGYLYAGEVVALEGENGSGKSTLLLTLAGILRQHGGSIETSPRARVHLVAHQPMAYVGLGVRRNLELAAAIEGKSASGITEALTYWRIEELAAKTIATLSRGQLQRFLLARAMLARPEILLLDEPFTGLDTNGEALLTKFIAAEANRGAAILCSDHDHKRARALSSRKIQMEAGRCQP